MRVKIYSYKLQKLFQNVHAIIDVLKDRYAAIVSEQLVEFLIKSAPKPKYFFR